MGSKAPWCDCKVAFGLSEKNGIKWFDREDWTHPEFLQGWELIEIDGSGARFVAIFRVPEGVPDIAQGRIVQKILNRP